MNFKDFVSIGEYDQITKQHTLYGYKKDLLEKTKAKFSISKDLKVNTSLLFLYEVNGLCRVNWEFLLNKVSPTEENVITIVNESKRSIEKIEKLNPDFTIEIKKAHGIGGQKNKRQQPEQRGPEA